MEHIGIDLGARHSHIAILSESGEVVRQTKVRTPELPRWLRGRGTSRVVMEACTQSPVIAKAAEEAGHKATVLPGQLVRAIGIGKRGIKTDERDALVLAEASHRIADLPGVHVRSRGASERRQLYSARQQLLESRKAISTSCKSFLRGRLQSLRGRANSKHFSEAVRTLAVEHPDGLPLAVQVLLDAYDQLTDQVDRLDQQIDELIENDPVCKNLMTMPGVGAQIALAFTSQLDDPRRFASAGELGSYLALVPGEHTTGGKIVRTRTLRAGPKYLKALLVQGAWVMWRCRPQDPLVQWARALGDRRGKRIAIVALARKMAVILWAMWKHGAAFESDRASRCRAQS